MPDWNSPEELAKDGRVFVNVIFVFFGLYLWEFTTTCDFEWSLITRKRKFTWPLVFFYFLCRYCMLLALVGLVLSLSVTKPINCNALYIFNSVTGNMAILNASTSLMIRTIAIWERKLSVIIPLGVLCLAHWGILWRGMFIVDAKWDSTQGACVVNSAKHIFLNVGFFTTMAVDFVTLCFTMFALLKKHHAKSDLWNLLFRDGLVYFVITFACNAAPAVLNVLNLNAMMNVIATIPAAAVASIAACRLVVRLQEFTRPDVYVHETPTSDPRRSARFSRIGSKRYTMPRRPEVVVTTDHFVMEDFSLSNQKSGTLSPVTPLDEKVEATLHLKSGRRLSMSSNEDHQGTDTVSYEVEAMV